MTDPDRRSGDRPERSAGGGSSRGGRGGSRSRDGQQEGSRPATARRDEPALPDEVTGSELDRAVRAELSSLAALNSTAVSRHLVMAGRLLDEDPELAYRHAVAARDRAGRVAAVREAAGIAAYLTGRYAEALAELRAARRMSGDQSTLPVMADCERGLGRPEKALELAASRDATTLDAPARAEMLIVASGARRDMGQPEAAVLMLQGPELRPGRRRAWSARLFYAYAEALLAAGRDAEAVSWFEHAAEADEAGETDADERLAELGGVTIVENEDD
jgi:tetratricopeptide (TPR) repeat protein